MTVEVAPYINSLNPLWPDGSDAKSEGDNHARLLKSSIKATFPNIAGAMTATHTELNFVAGVTSSIQTQLNAKSPSANPSFTGNGSIAGNWSVGGDLSVTGALTQTGLATFTLSPVVPTPAADDNSTKAASTAYVQNELLDFMPKSGGTFTGPVSAPTPSAGTNSDALATTAFVTNAIALGPTTGIPGIRSMIYFYGTF